MERPTSLPALDGLAIEAVEWLPSGSDVGLVRVRGRWSGSAPRERELPALVVRRAGETRRFESLPDARFSREPAVWRATYLVPAALMEPEPEELSLSWDSGAGAVLPAPARGFEPPQAPLPAVPEPEEPPGGEVIDRAVLAEHRARRAETAERAQARRAAEALKAVEVLELRSAELERRLEAIQAEQPAAAESSATAGVEDALAGGEPLSVEDRVDAATAAPPADVAAADPRAEALTAAIATVKRLHGELDEQRRRLRKSELLRAADAVALASLREQEGRVRRLEQQLSASRAELAKVLGDAEASAAAALAAREQAAKQVALAQQRAAADAASVRARAADELAAIAAELTRVRSALASVRRHAAERAAGLERRLAELEAALGSERRAHAGTTTERDTARAVLAAAEATNGAEALARAALEEELDRERVARAGVTATLATERTELTQLRSELAQARPLRAKLVLVREQARAEAAVAQAELAAALDRGARVQAELTSARGRLEAAHARIAELERAPQSGGGAPAAAEGSRLLGSITALEQVPGEDSDGRVRPYPAATQPPAADERRAFSENLDATAALRPAAEQQRAFSERLDAAAAALRERSPREPIADLAGAVPGASTQREYPWLRAALVRLAHDDPRAAARLMLALVPAQRALVTAPLEYDLTIRGTGTYAVSIGAERAATRAIREPRARDQAAFHVSADAVTLAELLAGVQKRMGRWIGSVKVQGHRRGAAALRDALVSADFDLAAAARAGADLDPDLVWRTLAYAIDPAWTRGHTFTVAQEITNPRTTRWHIGVRDGAPVTVERRAPTQPPDAVVSMSRSAFALLLRAEPAAGAERPTIRGDRAAVAMLKGWTDRAQGRAG